MLNIIRKPTIIPAYVAIICSIMLFSTVYAKEKIETIPIGLNMTLTGAVATTTLGVSYSTMDYLRWINDNGGFTYNSPVDGKLHRAKYKIMWADNAFSAARSITIVRRFIDRGAKLILSA